MENDNVATLNYKRFQDGLTYLGSKNLLTQIPKNVDFFEGKQWAEVTENTKHIPRPVFNICEKIVENKLSNILGTPIKLNFRADFDEESTEQFTKFASYQAKEMQQDWYDYLACLDGLVKGTYVYYNYWDENAVGRQGIAKGGMRCEVLDPLNVVVSNPRQLDCQKQEWIIIRDREPIEHVKSICTYKDKVELIAPDELETQYSNDIEQTEDCYVTVYTRFFRKNGEVYFEKSTKNVNLHDPRPMNPNIVKREKEEKEKQKESNEEEVKENTDSEIVANQDSNLEKKNTFKENAEEQYKFYLYPIEIGTLKPREKCIYGQSEIETIIPNQQAVNFQFSMILLNSQSLGWGKWIVKKGALQGQKITNQPGQVLVDNSPGNVNGIRQAEGQQFSNGAFDVANQIVELTKNVTGAGDFFTGDVGRDLSGTAIAQMQAQATKPIEQMQKRFWRSKERLGKIWEQFYKLYYENTEYSYEISQDEEIAREDAMQEKILETGYKGKVPPVQKMAKGTFNGKDFINIPFNIVVEAGKGTQYSEIMQMDFANNLILNNAIENISPENLELLLEMYPDSALGGMKPDLKKFIRKKQQGQIAMLSNQIAQQQQTIAQMTELLQQAQHELGSRDNKINMLGNYAKGLQNEYGKRINDVVKENSELKKYMQNIKQMASSEQPKNDKTTV